MESSATTSSSSLWGIQGSRVSSSKKTVRSVTVSKKPTTAKLVERRSRIGSLPPKINEEKVKKTVKAPSFNNGRISFNVVYANHAKPLIQMVIKNNKSLGWYETLDFNKPNFLYVWHSTDD